MGRGQIDEIGLIICNMMLVFLSVCVIDFPIEAFGGSSRVARNLHIQYAVGVVPDIIHVWSFVKETSTPFVALSPLTARNSGIPPPHKALTSIRRHSLAANLYIAIMTEPPTQPQPVHTSQSLFSTFTSSTFTPSTLTFFTRPCR